MYCPKCGTQNQDGVNFCQKCGNALNSTPVAHGSTYNNTPVFRSKSDFLSDYYSKHPSYYILIVFSIIFDIIGSIIIIYRIINTDSFFGYISPYQKEKLITSIVIGIIFWIIGSIFMLGAKSISKSALKEFEITIHTTKSENDRFRKVENDEWRCPNCGRINQHYVGTCGCGEMKP